MKLKFGIILLVISTFILSCDNKPKDKVITLKANGEVSFRADEADISVILTCLNMDIDSSKNCIVEKSQQLNETILGLGIKPEDILTTSINQSKEYKWQDNSSVFVGYKSSISTHLTIRDLKVLEKLYPALIADESITIDDLSYSHSKLDSLSNVAYLNALENANILSDKLLEKLNRSKKVISRISNIDLSNESGQEMILSREEKAIMNANGDATYIVKLNNGILKINRSLIVEYRIVK